MPKAKGTKAVKAETVETTTSAPEKVEWWSALDEPGFRAASSKNAEK